MKSDFYVCDWKKTSLLYVPYNMIITEWPDNDMFDVEYDPKSIKFFHNNFFGKKFLYFNSGDYQLVKKIDVSDQKVRELQDLCFNGNHFLAHRKAIEIFLLAKKQIKSK